MIESKEQKVRYVVDTNIIIYTLKGEEKAINVMEKIEINDLEAYFSTVVEAELFSFHDLTADQIAGIRELLNIGEVVDVDSEVAMKAAELRALSKKVYGRKLKLPDAIVAATALIKSAVLLTRNINDFKHLQSHGLRVHNPFDDQSEN